MGAIAKHLHPDGNFIIICDRDFRSEPNPAPKLDRSNNICTLARTNIDSYILEPVLIHRWWREMERGKGWKRGPVPELTTIETWIEQCVEKIEDYQCARWSLSSLSKEFNPTRLHSTWTKGELPLDLSLDHCVNQSRLMISNYKISVDTKEIDSRFNQLFEQYKANFQSPNFAQQKLYRYWFSGKDLRKALAKTHISGSSFPFQKFYSDAGRYLDYAEYPDLMDLVNTLKQMTK